MSAIKARELPICDINLYGSEKIPNDTRILLIGPESANKVKNSIANAEAMIRFGR